MTPANGHSKRTSLTAGDAGGRANVEFRPRLVELAIPPLMRCPNVAKPQF
jgi:hypothetical protein